MRLIADGIVDREGVNGLGRHLGYSTRQVERHLVAEVGAGPLALARAQRAQTARLLIEVTSLPFTEVAFASGFSSVRQFNDTVRSVFDTTPTGLRARTRRSVPEPLPGALVFRLPFRTPFSPESLFGHLMATAIPGCEEYRDGTYRRSLGLPAGNSIVALRPTPEHVLCQLALDDIRDLPTAIARCRRLLDLDSDPEAVMLSLIEDPALSASVGKAPGRRIPGTVDEVELGVRIVLGQQVSTSAARTHAARLVARHGTPISDSGGGLTHLFPGIDRLASIDPSSFALPKARQRCLGALISALASGTVRIGVGDDWERARSQLRTIPGIGSWSSEMIAMRAMGDPDSFPSTDMGVRKGAAGVGLPDSIAELDRRAIGWRPWRAYAVQYLWAALDHPINEWPPAEQL